MNRDAPTVDEVHRLYYLDKKNIAALERALVCESLASAFRDDFEARLQKLDGKTTLAESGARR